MALESRRQSVALLHCGGIPGYLRQQANYPQRAGCNPLLVTPDSSFYVRGSTTKHPFLLIEEHPLIDQDDEIFVIAQETDLEAA